MQNEILQLGAVATIFLFFIREVFIYLKSRKDIGSGQKGNDINQAGNDTSVLILEQLQLMNNNHLHSLEKTINDGNKEIVKEISDGNLKIIESLGEIKGKLSK